MIGYHSDAGSPDYDSKGWISVDQFAESELVVILYDT